MASINNRLANHVELFIKYEQYTDGTLLLNSIASVGLIEVFSAYEVSEITLICSYGK